MKVITLLIALCLPATVFANRPQQQLAEGGSCSVTPTSTIPTPTATVPTPTPTIKPPTPTPTATVPTPTPTITVIPPTPTPTATVPTPTPTITVPTPIPTTTITPTPTPIPPTPKPTEPCEFYKIEKRYAEGGELTALQFDEVVKQDEASKDLSCLDNLINEAQNLCTRDYLAFGNEELNVTVLNYYLKSIGKEDQLIEHFDYRYDDCMATYLTKDYMRTGLEGIFRCISNEKCSLDAVKCEGNAVTNSYTTYLMLSTNIYWYSGSNQRYSKVSYLCENGHFYMDSNCKSVQYDIVESDKVCGTTIIRHIPSLSPISLIWEHDYNINTNITFAAFRLNPNDSNPWTSWKASDKAPLLVYDPDKTNFVKDATQLFGNYTFGGKLTASLSSSKTSTTWDNGFEALATLDADMNGKIDGEELSDLALWFDNNRNGISEKGEVVRVKDSGVTALFYKGYKKDDLSNDLRLELGYERNVNGHTVQGASIDWYGASAPSKAALADYYSFVKQDDGSSINEPKATAANTTNGKFTGTWQWFIDENSNLPNGYLIFAEDKETNKVTGYSFIERPFSRSPRNLLKSMINFFRLEGTTDSKNGMTFELTDKNRKTKSVVTLSEDGKELHGTSYVTVARGAEIANYTWTAKKM